MTFKDLLAEQLDPKELKFRVDQVISRLAELDNENKKVKMENQRMKQEREREIARQRQQPPINTNVNLKNKPTLTRPTATIKKSLMIRGRSIN